MCLVQVGYLLVCCRLEVIGMAWSRWISLNKLLVSWKEAFWMQAVVIRSFTQGRVFKRETWRDAGDQRTNIQLQPCWQTTQDNNNYALCKYCFVWLGCTRPYGNSHLKSRCILMNSTHTHESVSRWKQVGQHDYFQCMCALYKRLQQRLWKH